MKFFRTVMFVVVLGCSTVLSGCGVHTVDTGFRGVKVSFGQVEGEPLTEGLYFVNPFTTDIHQMDTRLQRWDGQEIFLTKDQQQVRLQFTLNYGLDPTAVGTVYKSVGEDWKAKLVSQNVHNPLQETVGNWDAADLISQLGAVNAQAEKRIADVLKTVGITAVRLNITKPEFNSQYNQAVERKVVAQQDAETAANKTQQVEQEAKQKVIQAQAEAQSMKIRADALSQNPKLVEWEAVQKWNGQLPTYTMGGAMPFINMTPGK